jgi:drug/metabolite transporter (DMT)-like permease
MRHRRNVAHAFTLVFFSSLAFACIGIITKILTRDLPSNEIVFFRSVFNLTVVAAVLRYQKRSMFPEGREVLVLRGLAGFAGFVCYVYSVANLPVSIAALLTWMAPLFVMTFGRVFLNEAIRTKHVVAFGGAMVGLSFLVGPKSGAFSTEIALAPVLVGILGAVATAVAHVAVRAATKDFDALMIVFYYSLPATFLSFPMALTQGWVHPQAQHWPALIAIGLLGTFAQILITRAYSFLEAGPVSLMNLMSALMAVLLGAVFLDESLMWLQWVGVVVLGASVVSVLRKS